jgi:leucyl/phenylalanyl-tRNA--protein transferase
MKERFIYSPETIIKAYSLGVFPMAAAYDADEIYFYEPDIRGIIPLCPPHIPRKLLKLVRHTQWAVTLDRDFRAVIEGCSQIREDRQDSWINPEIKRLYLSLHKMGFAHSVEVWDGQELIGGLYGIHLGAAFFGESMFSRASNASKLALAHLMARLYHAGFLLLDAQFSNAHLVQFGLLEIPKEHFRSLLNDALGMRRNWPFEATANEAFSHLAQARSVTS